MCDWDPETYEDRVDHLSANLARTDEDLYKAEELIWHIRENLEFLVDSNKQRRWEVGMNALCDALENLLTDMECAGYCQQEVNCTPYVMGDPVPGEENR